MTSYDLKVISHLIIKKSHLTASSSKVISYSNLLKILAKKESFWQNIVV